MMLPVAREDVLFIHAHWRPEGVAAVRLRASVDLDQILACSI